MITCPRGCTRTFESNKELYDHLRNVHQLSPTEARNSLSPAGSGWHEPRQHTRDGPVALDHQIASMKSRQAQALTVPIVPPETKKAVNVPEGWTETTDGYQYEKTLSYRHTATSIIKQVLKAKVTVNHLDASLYTYYKDLSVLTELQDKARILEARLSGYTLSDPEYGIIASEIYHLKQDSKKLTESQSSEFESALVLEDYFRGDFGSDAHKEWQGEQMKRVISEGERLSRQNPVVEM